MLSTPRQRLAEACAIDEAVLCGDSSSPGRGFGQGRRGREAEEGPHTHEDDDVDLLMSPRAKLGVLPFHFEGAAAVRCTSARGEGGGGGGGGGAAGEAATAEMPTTTASERAEIALVETRSLDEPSGGSKNNNDILEGEDFGVAEMGSSNQRDDEQQDIQCAPPVLGEEGGGTGGRDASRTLGGDWSRFHDIQRESQGALEDIHLTLGALREWQVQRQKKEADIRRLLLEEGEHDDSSDEDEDDDDEEEEEKEKEKEEDRASEALELGPSLSDEVSQQAAAAAGSVSSSSESVGCSGAVVAAGNSSSPLSVLQRLLISNQQRRSCGPGGQAGALGGGQGSRAASGEIETEAGIDDGTHVQPQQEQQEEEEQPEQQPEQQAYGHDGEAAPKQRATHLEQQHLSFSRRHQMQNKALEGLRVGACVAELQAAAVHEASLLATAECHNDKEKRVDLLGSCPLPQAFPQERAPSSCGTLSSTGEVNASSSPSPPAAAPAAAAAAAAAAAGGEGDGAQSTSAEGARERRILPVSSSPSQEAAASVFASLSSHASSSLRLGLDACDACEMAGSLQAFTSDLDALLSQLDHLESGGGGDSDLDAERELEEAPPGNREKSLVC